MAISLVAQAISCIILQWNSGVKQKSSFLWLLFADTAFAVDKQGGHVFAVCVYLTAKTNQCYKEALPLSKMVWMGICFSAVAIHLNNLR